MRPMADLEPCKCYEARIGEGRSKDCRTLNDIEMFLSMSVRFLVFLPSQDHEAGLVPA